MIRDRRPLLAAVLCLFAFACTCGDGSTSTSTPPSSRTPTAPADGGNALVFTPPQKLQPTIRELGPFKGMPTQVVFEFSRAIAGGGDLNQPLAGKTVFTIEPALPGTLAFSGPSTLTFTPSDRFAHQTKYTVRLEAVETSQGVFAAPDPNAWSYTFSTPAFVFTQLISSEVDLRAGKVTAEVHFTGDVDPGALKKFGKWEVDGNALTDVRYAAGDAAQSVKAFLSSKDFKPGSTVRLNLAEGLPSKGKSPAKAPSATASFDLYGGKKVTIHDAHVQEGATGYFVEVFCSDEAVKGATGSSANFADAVSGDDEAYSDSESGEGEGDGEYEGEGDYGSQESYDGYASYRNNPGCSLADGEAESAIHFDPPVKFSVAPARGGFRIFGDFKRGTYAMQIGAGAGSTAGGILYSTFSRSFSVAARKPQLSFVSAGRYLPRSAWRNLAINHLNLDGVTLSVRHVPPENLIFWLTGPESADQRTSNVTVASHAIPLSGEGDTPATSWIDVGSLMPRETKGLMELSMYEGGITATSRILLTDLSLVAKRAQLQPGQVEGQQEVWAWGLDIHTGEPLSGVEISLIRPSGKAVARCTTSGKEGCKLKMPAEEIDPTPPFALVARKGDELTYLRYSDLKTEISESDVQGAQYASEQAYRAAPYSDRGVYRPGDTAHLAAIIRGQDDLAPPAGLPVELTITDPRSRVLKKLVVNTNEGGLVTLDLPFASFADTGQHVMQLGIGGSRIAAYSFQVEEFVPERMKVTAAPDKSGYRFGDAVPVNVEAKYLFGGSAEGAASTLTCRIDAADFKPKENSQFQFGPWKRRPSERKSIPLGNAEGTLDAKGLAQLTCAKLEDVGAFKGTGRLVAGVDVMEAGSGRSTHGEASVLLHPEAFYLGLQSQTQKAQAGKPFTVNGVVVDWNGALITDAAKGTAKAEVELYRLEAEYGYSYDEDTGYDRYQRYLRPVREGRSTVEISGGKFSIPVTPSMASAGYLIRVRSGAAETDLQLSGERNGYSWQRHDASVDQTPKPLRPTALLLQTPRLGRVGESVEVKFEAPYKGRVLLTAETNKILTAEWLEVAAGSNSWSFKPDAFTPNVYVSALLLKDPHLEAKESFLPDRAFGVASVPLEPTQFTAEVKVTVPGEIRSFSKLPVEIDVGKLDGPTYVTVAAVDEGILSLTRFETPNPAERLFVKRALGVETYETLGWTLLVPPGGPSRETGGDEEEGGNNPGRVQPVKPVALWSGAVKVGEDGKAKVEFTVPQYRGQLRVMAVVSGQKRIGRASAQVTVRDPITLSTTLPRFLSRGDEIQIPVFVTNLSGAPLDVKVMLTAEDLAIPGSINVEQASSPVQMLGKPEGSVKLADGKSGTLVFQARAVKATGAARIKVVAQGGGHESYEQLDVPMLPAGPKERIVQKLELTEGLNDLKKHLSGWLPQSESTTLWVTNNPYGESFDHLKYLIRYPYGCIEQTTSSTRPLLFVANLIESVDPTLVATGTGSIEAMVMSGVNRIFSMQTPSGGFAYWPGQTEPNSWGTAYATHMLFDAQKLGFNIPKARLDDAVGYMERELNSREGSDPGYWNYDEPYTHYVLALAGKARKARIEKLLQKRPKANNSEHDEQDYMLKAALFLAGDRRYEKELRNPDVSPVQDLRYNSWSFYSDLRRRGFILSTYQDLFGSDPAGEPLAERVAQTLAGHPSYHYTTQELVWGVTGLGKRLQSGAKNFQAPTLLANGKPVKHAPVKEKIPDRTWALARASEAQSLQLKVDGALSGKLYAILSSEGVREQSSYEVGGKGLALERSFHDQNGVPVDVVNSPLDLAQVVIVRLRLTNTSGEPIQNIALVDRLPAGFEIENPRLSRGSTLEWVQKDEQWEAEYVNVRDDRIEIFGVLQPGQSKEITYAARVVTSGNFTLPPAEAEAMYDPRIWARKAGGKVRITGPWKDFLL